jgi:hypothetical protein
MFRKYPIVRQSSSLSLNEAFPQTINDLLVERTQSLRVVHANRMIVHSVLAYKCYANAQICIRPDVRAPRERYLTVPPRYVIRHNLFAMIYLSTCFSHV